MPVHPDGTGAGEPRRGRAAGARWLEAGFGAVLLLVVVGVCIGVGTYTFTYGQGFSYFSHDPRACANCHIMWPQYDSWQKSSHHAVAACVDCHLPEHGIEKYVAKADNGFRHSWAFTFQDFHEPIQITRRNSEILQNNCVRCHESIAHDMAITGRAGGDLRNLDVSCVHCHPSVGHGPVK